MISMSFKQNSIGMGLKVAVRVVAILGILALLVCIIYVLISNHF